VLALFAGSGHSPASRLGYFFKIRVTMAMAVSAGTVGIARIPAIFQQNAGARLAPGPGFDKTQRVPFSESTYG
jgi:hypothetical protein